MLLVYYVQDDVGWQAGFGISAIAMASRKQHLVKVNAGNSNSCEEGEDPMYPILPQTKQFKIFISIIVMVVAALVESRRVRVARDYGLLDQPNTTLSMRIWWLLPQYVIIGIADVFTIVGLQELFYSQMPDGMRSILSAVYLSVLGVGSFLSSAIISIVESASSRYGDEWLDNNLNRTHLDNYYWVLAGLSTLWLGLFVVLSKGLCTKVDVAGLLHLPKTQDTYYISIMFV